MPSSSKRHKRRLASDRAYRYLWENDLHRATRVLLTGLEATPVGRCEQDLMDLVECILPPGLETKIEENLSRRQQKDPSGGWSLSQSATASSVLLINRAVARCTYHDQDQLRPSLPLLLCLSDRVEFLLRCEAKGLDYAEVLSDVELVLKWVGRVGGEEEDGAKMGKLVARQSYIRAFCLCKLGRFSESESALESATSANGGAGLGSGMAALLFKGQADKLRRAVADARNRGERGEVFEEFPTSLGDDANPHHPEFSASVDIVVEDEQEREGTRPVTRAVAAADIAVCEVVAAERAAAAAPFYLDEKATLQHCSHCLVFTRTPLPCPTCCDALFCSTACLRAAIGDDSGAHRWECRVGLATLLREWTADAAYAYSLMAVRALFRGVSPPPDDQQEDQQDETVAYLDAYFAVLAASWMRIVRHTGFLDGADERQVLDTYGRLRRLLKLCWSAQSCNVLEPWVKCIDPSQEMELDPIGRAFFPATNLVRHGCAQNVARIFKGDRVALIATRNIRAGEELILNPLFNLNMRRCDRIQKLRYPLFHGLHDWRSCRACVDNWAVTVAVGDVLEDDRHMKDFLVENAREFAAQSKGDAAAWLRSLRRVSSLLAESGDRAMFLLHGATNQQALRCAHYLYGLARFDPTCYF